MKKGWPSKQLNDICTVNPREGKAFQQPENADVSFVPMSAIDEKAGRITRAEVRSYKDVAKGYTTFRDNDVLFAKITPCMQNGKAAIARNLIGGIGFGSTEFHVLRSGPDVMPEWVYAFVRQPAFRSAAEANFTGTGGQQRVSTSFMAHTTIPVPPLPEQERIVKILDAAEELRQLRDHADRRTGELIPALFHEMFGDPATNPKGWPVTPLREVCDLINGRAFKPAEWGTEGKPIIRIQNLNDLGKPFNYYMGDLPRKYHVGAGDILLSWSGTPGTSFGCFRWRGTDGWLNQHIFNVRIYKQMDGEFFLHHVNAKLSDLIRKAHGGVGLQHVTKGMLDATMLMSPPLPLQREFAAGVVRIIAMKANQAASRRRLDDLFQSLLHRAFRGEL